MYFSLLYHLETRTKISLYFFKSLNVTTLSRSQNYLGSFYGISVIALAARQRYANKDLVPEQREGFSVHSPFSLNDFSLSN